MSLPDSRDVSALIFAHKCMGVNEFFPRMQISKLN